MKKISKLFDHKWWISDFIKWSGYGVIKLYYRNKKIYINGKKPKGLLKGRLIVCSNHVSHKDAAGIVQALWSRRIAFVIGQQLLEKHKAKTFFKLANCIGVANDSVNLESFKKISEVIERGHVVAIFPEGKISESEELLPFQSGTVMSAFFANADILPVYICKRDSVKSRWVIVYGERIKNTDLFKDGYPSIDEINSASEYLNKKEQELKQAYLDKWVNRKAK